MREIKVRFEEPDIQALERQAAAAGITRSELVRSRALAQPLSTSRLTTAELNRLLTEAYYSTGGSINRRQVDTLVSFVVARLAA